MKSWIKYSVVGCSLLSCISFSAEAQIVGSGKMVDPFHYDIVKYGEFKNGAVACAHPLAAEVGAAILKKGGNAFDAMIATQLALAVVYPGAGNIGGGGFLNGLTSKGKSVIIDFREKAPSKASRDMYLDKEGNPINTLSVNGHLSVGVPGTIDGLFKTMPYAKLSFKQLIEPAIALAEKGFAITEKEAASLNESRADFIKYNTAKKFAFLKEGGSEWKAGDTLIQSDLAATLKRVRDLGAKGFYEGKTAALIVAEMQRGHGLMTLKDLKSYQSAIRKPLAFKYRGYDIIGFPPPSSGGVILGQMMQMVEPYPLGEYGYASIKSVHLMAEAERRSYADRAKYLGDPDFWKNPDSALLDATYLQGKMKDFDPNKATPSSQVEAGFIHQSEETTHISISDKDGNIVSVTTTLNNHYGSKTIVAGAGFLLNDEMDDFSMKPGVPNMYGAVGGEANAIQPNKRMLSSMCPSLVLKNGKPYIVVGTPGGTTIPTSVFQALVNVIDFKMPIAEAINAPKFHHQWLPDTLFVEKDLKPELLPELENMGYKLVKRGAIGRTEIIRYNPDGKLEIAADKRGDDSVAGY